MRYKVLILAAALVLSTHLFPQKKLFHYLQVDTSYILLRPIEKQNKIIDLPQDLNCESARHNYLINNGKLFVQLDGSGKLFSVDSNNIIQRVDKTCYEGYNFYGYSFPWHNKIYNLGGWGFWKYDGGLRYYNEEAQEWFITAINKKIPFAQYLNAVLWHDIAESQIYVVFRNDQDAYLKKNPQIKDSIFVQCFNLKTLSWWSNSKPLIAENPIYGLNSIYKTIPTHLGLLTETNKGYYLYNFRLNILARLSDEKAAVITSLINKNQSGFFIINKTSLKIYNPQNDSIISINITKEDLIENKSNIFKEFTQINTTSNWKAIDFSLIALLIITLAIFLKREYNLKNKLSQVKKVLQQKESNNNNNVFDKSRPFEESLSIQEKDVLEALVKNTINNSFTTVDEINRILGTKNKDTAIQKNIRAEILSTLNEKFQVYAGTKDQLIERERTEFDKRVYHYRINENYLYKISQKK
jgi:hypothetical protein